MRYYLAILTTVFIFSTVEVATKPIINFIDPMYLSFLRFMISGIILIIPAVENFKKLTLKHFGAKILLGILGVTITISCFNFSLKYLEASTAAVIFSLNPAFSALFAFIFYKQKLSIKKIIGMVLGLIGVYIVCFAFSVVNFQNALGPALMLISAICFGAYIVKARDYINIYGAFFTTGLVFILGSFFYLPFIKTFHIQHFYFTMGSILYLAVIGTAIAYILYFYGLDQISVAVGSSLFYLKPIIASILAVIILHEKLKANFYIGLFIIMLGLFLLVYEKQKPEEEKESEKE